MTDVEIAKGLSEAQRRAYIATSRRSQPIEELQRKALKASGRHGGWAERVDLSFAKDAQRSRDTHYLFNTCWLNFCSQCGEFGRGKWDDEHKRYPGPISHKARCVHGPDYGTPYPGWSAATSPIPCPPGPQAGGWPPLGLRTILQENSNGPA